MKFAVIGGDRRSVLLAELLAREGYSVRCFAMEKAELCAEVMKAGCIHGCTYGAECVILPIPTEKNGLLNTPYSAQELTLSEVSSALWAGQHIFFAGCDESFRLSVIKNGLMIHDFLELRDFAVGNAAITAEAALSLMMQSGERSVCGARVLITGWGRIARFLAIKAMSLGAEVCIAARSSAARTEAGCLGADVCRIGDIYADANSFDYLVNTVPAQIIGKETLAALRPDCIVIELASGGGGFAETEPACSHVNIIRAIGLPGRYAPLSAAKLMKETVFEVLKEEDF